MYNISRSVINYDCETSHAAFPIATLASFSLTFLEYEIFFHRTIFLDLDLQSFSVEVDKVAY